MRKSPALQWRIVACAMLICVGACTSPSRTTRRAAETPQPGGFRELVSTKDRLPAGLPRDVPLPAYRRVLYSAESSLGVVVYFDSKLSADTIRADLLRGLRERGWTLRSCRITRASPEPFTLIVADKAGTALSAGIGFSPDQGARLNGKRYSYFVSVAKQAQPPQQPLETCGP